MADKCHLCLLGLIILSSLLTGTSGVNDDHVFISSGENVRLPCNNHLHDCKSTTWNYNNRFRHSATVELIAGGKIKKDTESHERLSLGSDCSLNIKNIITEDYGSYTCQQYVNGQHYKEVDARVYLHVLHGTSGVNDTHVFISSGENVRLPCNNHLHNCTSTTWIYNRHSAAVELIGLGTKKKDTERHERLSLGSDCSLNIKNIKEDSGLYTCRQYVNDKQQGTDADKICMFFMTEISAGSSAGVKLTISDSRYQISAPGHCNITLTTTLLNEDDNREWRCEVTHRNQAKTSVTYTVKSSAQDKTTTAVIPVHTTKSTTTTAVTSTRDLRQKKKRKKNNKKNANGYNRCHRTFGAWPLITLSVISVLVNLTDRRNYTPPPTKQPNTDLLQLLSYGQSTGFFHPLQERAVMESVTTSFNYESNMRRRPDIHSSPGEQQPITTQITENS
ncbi:Contactin-3 [Labeo rohita]|uniref:Contactin-3 n=1 Tax=Labeo rohita TaxID=84645 RepID=A0ABQ8MW00_LABRO|nr:Contactin-3 [Labeo rohita]